MKKPLLLITFSLVFLIGCSKPESNPEIRDPIYQDYLSELDLAKKTLESLQKTLEEQNTALKAVKPQTGQIKYARKRVEETEWKISKVTQQVQYFELKISNRLKESRKNYLIAFKKGAVWPSTKEIEEYKATQKLRRDKISADHNERIPPKDKPKQKSEAEPAEAHH